MVKIDKTKIRMTNGGLMKVKSIAECSKGNILQYFRPALSDNWSCNQFLVFLRVAVLNRFYCTQYCVSWIRELCHSRMVVIWKQMSVQDELFTESPQFLCEIIFVSRKHNLLFSIYMY